MRPNYEVLFRIRDDLWLAKEDFESDRKFGLAVWLAWKMMDNLCSQIEHLLKEE